MRKTIILCFVASALSFMPLAAMAQTLTTGVQNSEVRELQEILKSDPSIYPEGLTTGYYGNLTAEAVKRLQRRSGLAVTGIVDQKTRSVIWPNVEITVVSPNGGEEWKKGEHHLITWKASSSPYPQGDGELPGQPSATSIDPSRPEILPAPNYFPRVSIDLVSDSNQAVYHIGNAALYESQFSWLIPNRIPNAKDYRIRIAVGGPPPCLMGRPATSNETRVYYPCLSDTFAGRASDISDGTFVITGEVSTDPTIVEILKKRVSELREVVRRLEAEIQALEDLINRLGN